MTKITIETETIETDLTPSEAAAKIKEALGIAEWPRRWDAYWCVDSCGTDMQTEWHNTPADHYGLAHGNCSPTQEGLARYKGVMVKVAALWAIEQHRDKTFGAYQPKGGEYHRYGAYALGKWIAGHFSIVGGIFVPFRTQPDIERSFAECGAHWEVLK